jgi:hypothetical protein
MPALGSPGTTRRWSHLPAALSASICLALAFMPARRATVGLSMPYDMDHFREIASAQTIADGRWLQDPFYRDETLWYNPLLAATVAAVSKITGFTMPVAYIQSGPVLTTLTQLAFFAMAACLAGPWPAALALAVLLFSPPHNFGAWKAPTVSVWLFPSAFAATFFYAGLVMCWLAIERRRLMWWLAVGVSLGLTFLAHTAPALVLGICSLVSVVLAGRRGGMTPPARWAACGVILGAALVVSAPFLVSIVGRYHLDVVNREPLEWVSDELAIEKGAPLLKSDLLSVNALVAAVGLGVLLRRVSTDRGAGLSAAWLAAAVLLCSYGFVQQVVGFGRLPPLVPQHHFYFYVKAAMHLLTGVGAWAVVDGLLGMGLRRARRPAWQRWQPILSGALALGGIWALVAWGYPGFQRKADFDEYRREALMFSEEFDRTRVLERLRAETPPDAVVLATDLDSYYRVAPAGRAIVAIPAIQSNPYRAQGGRDNDQESMLQALLKHDIGRFDELADKYAVTHVLLGPPEPGDLEGSRTLTAGVREISSRGGYTLYARTAHAGR